RALVGATAHAVVDRTRLRRLIAEEKARFVEAHPRSRAAFEKARRSLLGGVPMNWMDRWVGGFPVVLDHAEGARASDIDGHAYVDFCLGDTGRWRGMLRKRRSGRSSVRSVEASPPCCRARTRSGSGKSSLGVLGCRNGSSRS